MNTTSATDKRDRFRALHQQAEPLLLPNPWDAGSARLFEEIGFQALATTSSGYAATLGRRDGTISAQQALTHAAALVGATGLPVSADLENGFGEDLEALREVIAAAVATGLAGASIEDYDRRTDSLYGLSDAVDRIAAAAQTAHSIDARFVLTARCENFLHERPDIADTVVRLQRYREAGADVVYAPGLTQADDIRRVVEAVDCPVNVLVLAGAPTILELAALGVRRVSVGGALAWTAYGAAAQAAREYLESDGSGLLAAARTGSSAMRAALAD